MRAAILQGERQIEIADRDVSRLYDDQIRITVEQCGLCASDVAMYGGKAAPEDLPNQLGHEIAGQITEVGDRVAASGRFHVGDRIAAWTPDGRGMADAFVAESRHCVPVSDHVRFPAIAEPLACVVNTVRAAAPAVGDHVVIVGATGLMGLLTVRLSALAGARRIIATGRRPEALELAQWLGATHVVNTDTDDLDGVVKAQTGGAMADVTYECTGVAEGLALGGAATRSSGTLAILGYHQGGPGRVDVGLWNRRGLRVANGHFRDESVVMAAMQRAVRLLDSGQVDASQLVTHQFALSQVDEAFRTATARPRGFVKAIVTPAGA